MQRKCEQHREQDNIETSRRKFTGEEEIKQSKEAMPENLTNHLKWTDVANQWRRVS